MEGWISRPAVYSSTSSTGSDTSGTDITWKYAPIKGTNTATYWAASDLTS